MAKKFRFRSEFMNDTVFTEGGEVVLAMFKDFSYETDDPEIAKQLEARGYQEYDLIGMDDVLTLADGKTLSVKDIIAHSPAIGKELLGLPKTLAKKAASVLPGFGGDPDKQDPPKNDDLFICEWCGSDEYTSQAALNGHKGHCKKRPPKDPPKPE